MQAARLALEAATTKPAHAASVLTCAAGVRTSAQRHFHTNRLGVFPPREWVWFGCFSLRAYGLPDDTFANKTALGLWVIPANLPGAFESLPIFLVGSLWRHSKAGQRGHVDGTFHFMPYCTMKSLTTTLAASAEFTSSERMLEFDATQQVATGPRPVPPSLGALLRLLGL